MLERPSTAWLSNYEALWHIEKNKPPTSKHQAKARAKTSKISEAVEMLPYN